MTMANDTQLKCDDCGEFKEDVEECFCPISEKNGGCPKFVDLCDKCYALKGGEMLTDDIK